MKPGSRNKESELKEQIIEMGKRLWTLGLVASNDGNISARINEKEIFITASGVSKGFLKQDMIIKMDMDGRTLSKGKKYHPSSEVNLHIEIYKLRNDVQAVVHAHPPYSTAFAVAGIPLDKCILPEAVLSLGPVPIAPYGTTSTVELADSIKSHIGNSEAILLANHGALTVGPDLLTAYYRMETLEHTARITHLAVGLGNINVIPEKQVAKLLKLKEQANIAK
jgi:L-fuculose-phosphate aldolase